MIVVKAGDFCGNLHETDQNRICFLGVGFSLTHRGLYFHCSPSLCHMRPNSRILKAAHRHTCSEPDLYLLLSPVSLGTPCPAHMIAPFPGPLLPAFTPFPRQLSLKWVEPLLSARLVKSSFPKAAAVGTDCSLSLSHFFFKVFKVSALFPLRTSRTRLPSALLITHTVHTHTHTCMLVTTHPQQDSRFG